MIKAIPPQTAPDGGDNSLPDATPRAQFVLIALVILAAVLAVVLNAVGATSTAFTPAMKTTANFALFAGFYVAAQVIERLMELVSPVLPFPGWPLPASDSPQVRAAQLKADRVLVALGLAAVLGVGVSCGFGLFFLASIGMKVSHTVDTFFTGITIAAGTKPLHDLITAIQNQSTPKTGTGT